MTSEILCALALSSVVYFALSIPATHLNAWFFDPMWKGTDALGRIGMVIAWPILLMVVVFISIAFILIMGMEWLAERSKLSVIAKLYPKSNSAA